MLHIADDMGWFQWKNRRRPSYGAPAVLLYWLLLNFLLLLTPSLCGQSDHKTGTGSQDSRKSSIYAIFETEMTNYLPSRRDTTSLIPVTSVIPTWLHLITSEKTDTLVMAGISDPGLPDSLAYAQARLRAFAMAAMARRCKGRFISDFYLKSHKTTTDSKFEEMYNFIASSSVSPENTTVIRDTILQSGEAVVLVAVPVPQETKSNDATCIVKSYLYNYEFEVDGRDRLMRKIGSAISTSRTNGSSQLPDSISFYEVNQRFTGIKNIQQKINPRFSKFEYYYFSSIQEPAITDENRIAGSSCKSGLWIAMLNQIFDQLSFFIKTNTTQTGAVNDQTEDTRNELNREKNQIDMRFSFGAINLLDNKLMVQIKISHEK
ncbi:MAG: hypothetical protein WCP32_09300 [Bacteroidota bacterium]